MKVYTKTGDKGMTSLVGGTRVHKTHERLEAYGTVDELNAHLGVLIAELGDCRECEFLFKIQHMLFVVGAHLATESAEVAPQKYCVVAPERVTELELEIDRMQDLLPPLKAFVLPSGTKAAALAHVCRTVCRRAERCVLRLAQEVEVDAQLLAYVNRLSDYLFVLSRFLNVQGSNKEIFWQNSCK